MRDKGLEPIPVYHSRSPLKYLEYYIAQTDYIAISVDKELSRSERIRNLDFLWDEYLTDAAGNPLLKVHGLGISSAQIKFDYPWYSLDGTAWVQSSRFGRILVPKKRHGKYVYDAPPNIVPVTERSRSNNRHLLNRDRTEQDEIMRYIEEKQLQFGL
jgi:hypothetical protein